MNLYLDDCEAHVQIDDDAVLSDLLKTMKDQVDGSHRLIVGVQCDGLDVTGDGFAETLAKRVDSFDRIDMQTADPKQLVAEALETATALLDETAKMTATLVDQITGGEVQEALPKLGDCCQAWLQVHGGVCNAVGLLGIDADNFKIDDRPIAELLSIPVEHLKQLKEAIEVKDFVLLTDVLTYEFTEATDAWRKIITALQPVTAAS